MLRFKTLSVNDVLAYEALGADGINRQTIHDKLINTIIIDQRSLSTNNFVNNIINIIIMFISYNYVDKIINELDLSGNTINNHLQRKNKLDNIERLCLDLNCFINAFSEFLGVVRMLLLEKLFYKSRNVDGNIYLSLCIQQEYDILKEYNKFAEATNLKPRVVNFVKYKVSFNSYDMVEFNLLSLISANALLALSFILSQTDILKNLSVEISSEEYVVLFNKIFSDHYPIGWLHVRNVLGDFNKDSFEKLCSLELSDHASGVLSGYIRTTESAAA